MLQGYGSFSGFLMSMYVMYLLAQRKLNIHMSSYQVMRNTLLKLGEWQFVGFYLIAYEIGKTQISLHIVQSNHSLSRLHEQSMVLPHLRLAEATFVNF